MTVKGLKAKTKSTDFPTNLREYAMLILILHSHCYIGEAGDPIPFLPSKSPIPPPAPPSLLSTELAIVLPSSFEEARPSAPHPLCLPSRGKVHSWSS